MKYPYCNQEAQWVANKEIYGRNYGKSYMTWVCFPCDAYVGCHKNTRKPLGVIANAELRDARKRAHAIIDPLWKSGGHSRKHVYLELMDAFGKPIHVGNTETVEECEDIIKTAKLIFKL